MRRRKLPASMSLELADALGVAPPIAHELAERGIPIRVRTAPPGGWPKRDDDDEGGTDGR